MNASSHTEAGDETEIGDIQVVDIILCIAACLLCVFVCTGNVMTILAIVYTPSLRTMANIYVASLAVADFIIGLTFILLALFSVPTTRIRIFYRFINVCVLMYGLSIGMTSVSAIHMTIISVDRYLYISHPYFYERVVTIRVVAASMGFAWTFGIIYTLLPQFIHRPYPNPPVCDVSKLMPIEYLFYATAAIYWALVGVIVVMYSLILQTALRQGKAIHSAGSNDSHDGGERRIIRRGTVKSIKFFLTVFGVFFVCLTPVLVCMGLDYFVNVPVEVYRFFNLLGLTNSGMNFIIYAVLNRQFRFAFFRMLRLKPNCHDSQHPEFSGTRSLDYTATHF